MTWHLGVATGACVDLPVAAMLDHLAAVDLHGIELGTAPRHFATGDAAQVRDVRARLASQHKRAISIHAPFGPALDLADSDPRRRRAGIDAIVGAATSLHELGGRVVVAHPSDLTREGLDVEACLAHAVWSLEQVHAACAHLGMVLAVETPLPHLIGGHPDEFAWLLHRLPPDVGVCLDTGHTALGRWWRRFVDVAGHAVVHVHAHDNRGHADEHLPPGDGTIDWRDVHDSLTALDVTGGWIMLELACPAVAMEPYVQRAIAQARALLPVETGARRLRSDGAQPWSS
jgi:sugar phosphate isomerase/epimerase